MNRSVAYLMFCFLLTPLMCKHVEPSGGEEKNETESISTWWSDHPLRIVHLNFSDWEVEGLDVDKTISLCREMNAEAIVFSVGGIYAYYPTGIQEQYMSPTIGNRDLVGEIVEAANRNGIRVIARLDFGKAREEFYEVHPDWFIRTAGGNPKPHRVGYSTCPLGGYRNEEVGFRIIGEIFDRYDLAGVHFNSPGYHDYCTCENCTEAFGGPIPTGPEGDPEEWRRYLIFRRKAISGYFERSYQEILNNQPDALFMGELTGPQSLYGDGYREFHAPYLKYAYTHVLQSHGGELKRAKEFRWWVPLSAELALGAGCLPITNLKVPMRELYMTHALKPPHELRLYIYQSIAHHAGLKIALFPGLPQHALDERTIPLITEAFGFLAEHDTAFRSIEPLREVAILWPDRVYLEKAVKGDSQTADPLSRELLGLAQGLTSLHVQWGIIWDEFISDETLKPYHTLILPTAAYLTETQAQDIRGWVAEGGHLVWLDSPFAGFDPEGSFAEVPEALASMLGLTFTTETERRTLPGEREFAFPENIPGSFRSSLYGPIGLEHPFRRVVAGEGSDVRFLSNSGFLNSPVAPEEQPKLEKGDHPLSVRSTSGEGSVVYWATSLGQLIYEIGHPDYLSVLDLLIFGSRAREPLISTDAPGTVDMTLSTRPGGYMLQLVNATGEIPLIKPVPLAGLEISLDIPDGNSAVLLQPGYEPIPLEMDVRKGRRIIHLNGLQDLYAMILIENQQ